MFTNLFRWVYPKAPPTTSRYDLADMQHATIESLAAHIARRDGPLISVRVRPSVMPADKIRYMTPSGDFDLVLGLDPFGDNVITSALPSGTVTNSATASASVTADTVAKKYIIEKSGDVEPVLSALKKLDEAPAGGIVALTPEEMCAFERVRVLNEARPATVEHLSQPVEVIR